MNWRRNRREKKKQVVIFKVYTFEIIILATALVGFLTSQCDQFMNLAFFPLLYRFSMLN